MGEIQDGPGSGHTSAPGTSSSDLLVNRAKAARYCTAMKRGHDDISDPVNGIVPPKGEPEEVASGSEAVKIESSDGVQSSVAGGTAAAGSTASTPGGGVGAAGGGDRRKCPYLDTINRNVLDFDFEKVRLTRKSSSCWKLQSLSIDIKTLNPVPLVWTSCSGDISLLSTIEDTGVCRCSSIEDRGS